MNHTVLPLLGATLIAEGNVGLMGALAAATIFFAVEVQADAVLLLALEDPEAADPPGEPDDAHAVTDPIIAAQYIKSDALLQRNLISSNRFTSITVYGQTDLPFTPTLPYLPGGCLLRARCHKIIWMSTGDTESLLARTVLLASRPGVRWSTTRFGLR
jgi:hypothetical protein